MHLRQRNQVRQEEVNESLLNNPTPADEEKATFIEKEHLLTNMEQALEQLNEEQRICVKLFYLEKCSYQDITTKTGYSILQVKSYIQNGKRNLKMLLSKQGKQ